MLLKIFIIENNLNKSNSFQQIHEFSKIDEIKDSLLTISSKLRLLRFKSISDSIMEKEFFITLDCSEIKNYSTDDLVIPSELEIISPKTDLLDKVFLEKRLKILIKLEVRLKAKNNDY